MLLWSENMGECNNKILIVISGNLFIRNYILTDAFHKLEENHDCHYLVNKNTTMVNEIIDKKGFKEFYEIAKKSTKIHPTINRLACVLSGIAGEIRDMKRNPAKARCNHTPIFE